MITATQRERIEYLITELKEIAESTDSNLGLVFMGENNDGNSTMAAVVTNMTPTSAAAFKKNFIVGYIVESAIRDIAGSVEAKEKTEKVMEGMKGLSTEEMIDRLGGIIGKNGLNDA